MLHDCSAQPPLAIKTRAHVLRTAAIDKREEKCMRRAQICWGGEGPWEKSRRRRAVPKHGQDDDDVVGTPPPGVDTNPPCHGKHTHLHLVHRPHDHTKCVRYFAQPTTCNCCKATKNGVTGARQQCSQLIGTHDEQESNSTEATPRERAKESVQRRASTHHPLTPKDKDAPLPFELGNFLSRIHSEFTTIRSKTLKLLDILHVEGGATLCVCVTELGGT